MLALLAAYLVFGEFDESDPAQNGSGADSSTASQTADENNGLSENGATQFQAENTDEEELAKRYYYSQLDENRQMIYRELVQGIAEHQETIITKGGVQVKEVDPKTMESKKTKGLYFAGEVLDLDALTGGYNLQIAWSTAHAAAMAAAEAER